MIICKKFSFDAAHKIATLNDPKESQLHGHSYELLISLQGEVHANGVVMDFTNTKTIVTNHIINKLDHSFLNDFIEIPTAENISIWIWENLAELLPLYEVQLWETSSNCVIYRGV